MSKRKYENDFKVMLLDLLKSGKKVKELSSAYGIHESVIRRWKREFQERDGDFSKKKELSAQDQELQRLKKELSDVKMERDILKKAVSIFSKNDK